MSTTEPTKTISDYEATLAKADTAVASFEKDDKSIVPRLRNFLRKNPTMIPALVLILSIAAFSIIAPRFLGVGALSTVLKQVTVTGFVALAQTLGVNPEPFVLAVLFGCNLSFATPIAYQTNLLIMSEGGYEFGDYVRAGVPLVALMVTVLSVLLVLWYGL